MKIRRSQWLCGLRSGSAASRLLGLRVRYQPGEWMCVSYECCVLSGTGLCFGLITRPEKFCRVWCVSEWDRQDLTIRRPWSTWGNNRYSLYKYANLNKLVEKCLLLMLVQVVESSWNVMAQGDARERKWKRNWRMEWLASTLHTTSEHGVSSITTADAHTSAVSSRLKGRPRWFKWTRPFRRKTKFVSCACAITFQTQSTYGYRRPLTVKETHYQIQ